MREDTEGADAFDGARFDDGTVRRTLITPVIGCT